jgi:hypothetical protein
VNKFSSTKIYITTQGDINSDEAKLQLSSRPPDSEKRTISTKNIIRIDPNKLQNMSKFKTKQFETVNDDEFSFSNPKNNKIVLTFWETINPFFCNPNKKMKTLKTMSKLIENQLDINVIISKINMIDKITFLFSGEKLKDILENSVNPILYHKKDKKDDCKILHFDFNEIGDFSEYMKTNLKSLIKMNKKV